MRIAGLLISAGLSGRMGKFKPLLEFEGKTFLLNIAEKISAVCDELVIVTGHKSGLIKKEIESSFPPALKEICRTAHNPGYASGMFTSLQTGVKACAEADWVMYHFVDQPSLPEKFYTRFKSQIGPTYDWIQPAVNGRNGHPLLFNRVVCEKILAEPADSNLRLVSSRIVTKKIWECGDDRIFTDIDTPDDYQNKL